ncbi:MAG: GNAT family N-acetyltransferase [Ilumatobacter sp.]|nr:GNAT family N-acetyltransferase [Ilumatobacter sp.]
MAFGAIRTARLLLRPVRLTDAPALAERRSDPEVAALQSWTTPYPLERAQQLIADVVTSDRPRSGEWWMLTITDLEDTVVHGDLAIHPTWDGRAIEIGYTLSRPVWGNGYAHEAVEALVERLFDDERLTRVHAMAHPDNIASAQVLERNGFLYEGRTRLSYWVGDENTDDVLYGLTRADWGDWRSRPRTPPADVRLVEITHDMLGTVRDLTTHKSQERFVAPVGKWFANALYPPVWDGTPLVPWLRAIEADGEVTGLVLLARSTPVHPEPYLWRLLVDRRHQRRGIGRRAIDIVVTEARASGAASLAVSWLPGRGSPEALYLRCGFVPTGDGDAGDVEARLRLD